MCTVVLSFRPGHAWPVGLAANRDERVDRAWDPPDAHWPEYPGVIAGRDHTAGGTWMGLNQHGVTAAVLNRPGSLGPAPGKRSRGDLPLRALTETSAAGAAEAIGRLDAGLWRGFNLVIADRDGAFFLRGTGHGRPEVQALPPGVTMITAHDPNSLNSPRVARHLASFQAAPGPEPDDWTAWRTILSDRSGTEEQQIDVVPRGGFGTVCSSMLMLPAAGDPVWLFASGPPHLAPFTAVSAASRP